MKRKFSFILLLSLSVAVFGQKKETLSNKEKAIVEQFKNEYKKKNYKKFEGKIIVKDGYAHFDDKTFLYDKSDKITVLMLEEGLIYPQLLTDYQMEKFIDESTDRTQKRFLRLQKDPRAGFDVNNVKLNNATELTFLGSSPKTKRFKITCKDNKLGNQIQYLIELTNKNANKETSMEEFIKNSTLTYLQQQRLD
ncbi:hypothetical protein IQ37_03710 [Chryseobacterium piperi]|uniref:Uncharacterized protein n=1 Tax=Chryseobacterium piperi TaxID=558152 RepID=A0A086BLF7_9FLAO|nr:hypothetical protein [Chryseobacterium piperi]ASW73321.1 hypothetical protein CJF12_02785 [Chryseobacterium piperi]KFF29771.1 hypothetical protein IQ37_03710 [Chryseobacterium piperi]